MSLQDRNLLVDFTLQNKQDKVAEAQKAVLVLWLQDTFTGMHQIFFSLGWSIPVGKAVFRHAALLISFYLLMVPI